MNKNEPIIEYIFVVLFLIITAFMYSRFKQYIFVVDKNNHFHHIVFILTEEMFSLFWTWTLESLSKTWEMSATYKINHFFYLFHNKDLFILVLDLSTTIISASSKRIRFMIIDVLLVSRWSVMCNASEDIQWIFDEPI